MTFPLSQSQQPQKDPLEDIEDPYAELMAIEAEFQKRNWQDYPEQWVEERLQEQLWSLQRGILRSVAKNRRTLVKSCHEIGKSWLAGRIAAWWLDVWPAGTAFVVTT